MPGGRWQAEARHQACGYSTRTSNKVAAVAIFSLSTKAFPQLSYSPLEEKSTTLQSFLPDPFPSLPFPSQLSSIESSKAKVDSRPFLPTFVFCIRTTPYTHRIAPTSVARSQQIFWPRQATTRPSPNHQPSYTTYNL